MARRKKYSQALVDKIHADRLAGDTLRELCREYRLTQSQLAYVLYTRSPTETAEPLLIHPDQFNNKGQKGEGSAPPSKKGVWETLKMMLGLKGR